MKKNLFKSLALFMVFSFGFSSNVLAASSEESILLENERISEIEMLINSYGLEVLSDEELSDLNLNQDIIEVLPESISVEEIEELIIEKKEQLEKEIEVETEVYFNDLVDENDNPYKVQSSLKSSAKTGTKIISSTYSSVDKTTFRGRFNWKSTCAASVQYDYVQYPLDPPVISNEKFISWDNGNVYEVYSDGSNKLTSLDSSKVTKVNDKKLKHTYKFTYTSYVVIPLPGGLTTTVKMGTGTVNSTTYYNLSI